jgi:hypothetical protein
VATPFPLLFDVCLSFVFTYDIVSNDLYWYNNWLHYDDVMHFLNSIPFMLMVMLVLLSVERAGKVRLGLNGLLLFGLSLYISGHAFWEMWEFAMDAFTGTMLQPGGMAEATRNNLAGVGGALIGAALVWAGERRGMFSTAVDATTDYLRAISVIR